MGPRPTYPGRPTCISPRSFTSRASATCAVNAMRRGAEPNTLPSRARRPIASVRADHDACGIHVRRSRPTSEQSRRDSPVVVDESSTLTPSRTSAARAERRRPAESCRAGPCRAKLNVSNRPTTPAAARRDDLHAGQLAGEAAATHANTSCQVVRARGSIRARYSEQGFSRGNRRGRATARAPPRAPAARPWPILPGRADDTASQRVALSEAHSQGDDGSDSGSRPDSRHHVHHRTFPCTVAPSRESPACQQCPTRVRPATSPPAGDHRVVRPHARASPLLARSCSQERYCRPAGGRRGVAPCRWLVYTQECGRGMLACWRTPCSAATVQESPVGWTRCP